MEAACVRHGERARDVRSLGGQNVADEVGADLALIPGYRVGYAVLNSVWMACRNSVSACSSGDSR